MLRQSNLAPNIAIYRTTLLVSFLYPILQPLTIKIKIKAKTIITALFIK